MRKSHLQYFMSMAVTVVAVLLSGCHKLPDGYTMPALPQIPDHEVTLTDFGVRPNDAQLCTQAFVEAIDHLESMGGGTLHVPKGAWITGPIVLKSHICLDIQEDACLMFSPELSLYATRQELWGEGGYKYQAPICAYRATDVKICGKGVIDGGGERWRPMRREYAQPEEWQALMADTVNGVLNADSTRWMPINLMERDYCMLRMTAIDESGQRPWYQYKNMTRPENVWLYDCERVQIEGITIRNSPMWNVHPELCRDLTISNCNIQNDSWATNGDGLDLESCSHVYVGNCTLRVGDDAICLKSGADEAGRLRGRPTEDVLVEDCCVYEAHGGFVVGSEMSGGVRNVYVRNCAFEGTDSGLRFKTNRQRGGTVENIEVKNVSMYQIKADALLFDMYYRGQSPVLDVNEGHSVSDTLQVEVNEKTPVFRGIHFSDIGCIEVGRTFYFDGLAESPVHDITIKNLSSLATAPSLMSECENISLKDIYFLPAGNQEINLYHTKGIEADEETQKYLRMIDTF